MSEIKPPKPHFSLRTEADLIEAHERIANGLLNGEIDPAQASAISRVLKGSQFLISELPYKKFALWLKLQGNHGSVPDGLKRFLQLKDGE